MKPQLTLVPRPLAKTSPEPIPAPVPPAPRPEYRLDAGSTSGGWWVHARDAGATDWRQVAWLADRDEASRFVDRRRSR